MQPPRTIAEGALISLASLAFRERRLVLILRGLHHPEAAESARIAADLAAPLHEAFARLAREAKSCGIQVLLPVAPVLSLDENTILHRIAALQRPSISGHWRLVNALQQAMKACADALGQDARRLPARAILQERDTSQNPSLRIECAGKGRVTRNLDTYARRRAKLWDGHSEPPPGTLKAKAVEIVRRHPVATTAQFLAAGITHQYLSALHHDGFVERIGQGVYSFPSRLMKKADP